MADDGQRERSQRTSGPRVLDVSQKESSSRSSTGRERKAVSTAKQRESQGLSVLTAATFSFWVLSGAASCQIERLGGPCATELLSLLPYTLDFLSYPRLRSLLLHANFLAICLLAVSFRLSAI